MIGMQKSISLKILLSPKNKLLVSNTSDKTLMEKIRLMDTLAVTDILIAQGTEADFDLIAGAYKNAPTSQEKVMMTDKFGSYLF